MDEHNKNDNDNSAIQILQDINSGFLNPKLLVKVERQKCVELLVVSEGYTIPQIAQVLKCSDRTINRDLKDIHSRNALSPDIEFAKQLIGQVFNKAMNHHGYLVRLARTKEASVTEKMQSEFAAWKILKELIEKFQTLGYLPLKPSEVVGNFYHHDGDVESSPEEMRKMLLGLEQAAKEAGVFDEQVLKKIEELKFRINQSEIALDIKQLEQGTLKKEINHEE